jgi:hypothetical protein
MDLDELERLRGVYDRATKCTSLIGAERLSLILDARAMYETALFAAAQELVRDARRMEWAEANVTTGRNGGRVRLLGFGRRLRNAVCRAGRVRDMGNPGRQMVTAPLLLTDSELRDLTGRVFRQKQVEELARLKIPYIVNAQGRICVSRAAAEKRLGVDSLDTSGPEPDFSVFERAAS